MRKATAVRKSAETDIKISVNLDGGAQTIDTGVPFFDHLLAAFGRHGRLGLEIRAKGDLEIDSHHTVEDVGIVLGRAVRDALGDRKGIERMGDALVPMDEALIRAVFDLSGRSYLSFRIDVPGVYTPTISLTVLEGFWKAFCDGAGANLHLDALFGRDYHHVVEAMFKACGRALRAATRLDGTSTLASTKELIDS
jgi:imidazoleglycerol-phosphate dehydratase